MAHRRWRQDARKPDRGIRSEELRDPVRAAARDPGAPAPDRGRDARVRGHRRPDRAPANGRAPPDLASGALAETWAQWAPPAAVHHLADEADSAARALLAPAPARPLPQAVHRHGVRTAGARRHSWRI